ncbi:peptidase T [Clostridiaceae bacterium UIB06]|uniref:Peptidase T n=1 Tax=Clostridium thailandense TaxID=2794346 RepID=A0A949TTQ1_9CLOT|nr:peptidase T [Clostridium thailandense]MBV7273221.1 peptidase T [Clostridium thailandense]MCH5136078.1 peptidase T [Clostridiaceae bacterium UIB06]
MSRVVEKFIKYIKYDTRSDENSVSIPTTLGQLELAKELVLELENMGMKDVLLDNNGYIMATLPSNIDKEVPVVGFIAHIDTSPEVSGANITPKFVENYNGEDIILNEEKNIILSPKDFPELKNYIGKTLITSDGTTLLGADDKSGIAEIMTAMEFLIENPQVKHGTIRIAFTTDEEVGKIGEYFDVEKFNADLAYTLDGEAVGELKYENFNAASAKITINGKSVHTGEAKGRMINSLRVATELLNMLPEEETPENTEGYEGFYYIASINGKVEQTKVHCLIRDFDDKKFDERKAFVAGLVQKINKKYGDGTATIELTEQYRNMKEKIEAVKYIVDIAIEAMKEVNIFPDVEPLRGGTDGARLSYMGLPTPNLSAGGHNFHSKYEYISTYAMEKSVEVILKIIELFAEL